MEHPSHPRRTFILSSLGIVLGGCASSGSRLASRDLPRPPYDLIAGGTDDTGADPQPTKTAANLPAAARPRATWAGGAAIPSRLNKMTKIRAITVHHDAMVFTGRSDSDTRARLESIRRSHLNRSDKYGDIGYHFAVDRNGTVWQCRELKWQGAHVRTHNEGNIGIVLLGNFEKQQPSRDQVAGMQRLVLDLRGRYRVAAKSIYTHREWGGAATLCPGRSLQAVMVERRRTRAFG